MSRALLVGLACATMAVGCGDMTKAKAAAERQVVVFHDALNAGKFEQIYADADADFRAAAPKDETFALFSAVEKKLGKTVSSSTKGWNVRSINFVTRVVLTVSTQFERGNGDETFTFRVADGKANLVGYNIHSLDMMTR